MNTAKELNEKIAERNKLNTEIFAIKSKIADENSIKLIEETQNLLDGVGEGFVSGDYYADDRYYSDIPGVKNIRIPDIFGMNVPEQILIKLETQTYLPDSIIVSNVKYNIEVTYSRKYEHELMY